MKVGECCDSRDARRVWFWAANRRLSLVGGMTICEGDRWKPGFYYDRLRPWYAAPKPCPPQEPYSPPFIPTEDNIRTLIRREIAAHRTPGFSPAMEEGLKRAVGSGWVQDGMGGFIRQPTASSAQRDRS